MVVLAVIVWLGGDLLVAGCGFARSGELPPDDEIHRPLSVGFPYPVLPRPVSTENNAFVTRDLFQPNPLSGNDEPLFKVLADFAASEKEDLCYWAWQGLAPPRGGPTPLHPFRGHWDVSDGHLDQDIEWVQAYGDVAVSRLHGMVERGGPVVSSMCSLGARLMARRCENGRANRSKCIAAITNATVAWPMAVSMWKVGHRDLHSAMAAWRGHRHLPNILWDTQWGAAAARPWTAPLPRPGDLNPEGMPQGPSFPVSEYPGWGQPKIAKVVRCADIPSKFVYPKDLFYCDHMPNDTATVSSVDEAYAAWRKLRGVWPPTKQCADDVEALNKAFPVPGSSFANCTEAYAKLRAYLPNFDCDNSDSTPTFRHVCCSVCGEQPIPRVPVPTPAPPPSVWDCYVCDHVYDAERDGNGTAFEDLPETWVCPQCGAPKKAYTKRSSGDWTHTHQHGLTTAAYYV